MILYGNRDLIRQILEVKGSFIYDRTSIVLGILIAAISVLCQYLIDIESAYAPSVPNNYAIGGMASIIAFATVFRSSLGLQKYTDAVSQVQTIYSKLLDVFTQYSVF